MPAVKPHAVAGVEPVHGPAQIALGRLRQEVVVIIHQHIGVNSHAKVLAQFSEQFQKVESVAVIAKDVLAFNAPRRHMIAAANPFDPQRPGHVPKWPAGSRKVKCDLSQMSK